MGGFGKTVLAAEAIRDEEIITDIFPGRDCTELSLRCRYTNLIDFTQY